MRFNLDERVKIAYKKLKASVYFDKTQLPLRDRIVAYESKGIERQLTDLRKALNGSDTDWSDFERSLLDDISAFVFPKSLQKNSPNMVILNSSNTPIRLDKPQYFIDLPVNGHILGVLWVLSIGKELDKNCEESMDGMYEHSYGNRLKKNLINPESGDITYSPYLFEPYFSQYESWRDRGLARAKERLNDKQDAVILTLDLKSFYYSVNFQKEDFDKFAHEYGGTELWTARVNDFVYQVLCQYSDIIRPLCNGTDTSIENRTILPIGFLPSNILSNWVLTGFDDAIIEQWNPVYYGRYVDDVIIVDKVEKNSHLYKKAREKDIENSLTADDVIKMFLMGDTKPILVSCEENSDATDKIYQINPVLFCNSDCHVCIQNSKVKVFYFQSGATQALLNCFQTQIARNVSEFRMMPDMDRVLRDKDYSEIFDLRNSDSINKLRSVEGITINKFSMSKFLGKYRKVCSLINDKKEENAFEKDLMVILDEYTLVENYSAWERIFEILVVNDRIKLTEQCALRIISAIKRYEVPEDKVNAGTICVKEGLLRCFRAALCRATALTWGAEINHIIEKISSTLLEGAKELGCMDNEILSLFNVSCMQQERLNYCRFRMINKYVLPLPIDCMIGWLESEEYPQIHLCDLTEDMNALGVSWKEEKYHYYPYMFTPQEIGFALLCGDIHEDQLSDPKEQRSEINSLYLHCNYPNITDDCSHVSYQLNEIDVAKFGSKNHAIYVGKEDGSDWKDKLCVAIGNAELKIDNFKAALDGKPNRSYQRYRNLSKMLDAAIEQKVDLLVLPENYMPLEWIPTVARFCANNQIGLITGVEHVIVPKEKDRKRVYNLTAVILPYEHQNQKFAHAFYHSKVNFSPEEKRQIEGHHGICQEGKGYQLFCWRGIWFPVYCCFELASINDRAIFRSYADMVVAVEWNTDIAYFSSIIESMCRDLHCYCVQANSSGPGDSRVLQPTKSELRDIIKTKGGKNPCILAADIDIRGLREFQALQYPLQKDAGSFKPTPPDFDPEILENKRRGTLFEYIDNGHFFV